MEPNLVLMVEVSATASPFASTTDTWVVPESSSWLQSMPGPSGSGLATSK